MLKFDLTRKYIVGFLTLAMVLSLFALPVSAAIWTVTALPLTALNPTTSITHTITINTNADGFLADMARVFVAVGFGGAMTSNLPVVQTGTGIYTYTALYGTAPFTSGPGTYTFYAYIDDNVNGVFDPADLTSPSVTKTWADPVKIEAFGGFYVIPNKKGGAAIIYLE